MDANTYKCAFPLDTDHRIKNIENKKISMQKILQNLKYFGQDVSMKINTKRIYTPPSASEFEFEILEARNQQLPDTIQ